MLNAGPNTTNIWLQSLCFTSLSVQLCNAISGSVTYFLLLLLIFLDIQCLLWLNKLHDEAKEHNKCKNPFAPSKKLF